MNVIGTGRMGEPVVLAGKAGLDRESTYDVLEASAEAQFLR